MKLWDVVNRREIATMAGHKKDIRQVAFFPGGNTLASGSEDGTVRLWNVATGEELLVLRGHSGPVFSVAISDDGQTLVSAGETGFQGEVKLWHVPIVANAVTQADPQEN